MESTYISGIIKQFNYYKVVGNKALEQLTFEEMNVRHNEDSNSISIIVKHMAGSMLNRWTNFLTEDGEKSWRERDQEFEATCTSKEEIIKSWKIGWTCLFSALKPLSDKDMDALIFIRNEGHTAADAVLRNSQ